MLSVARSPFALVVQLAFLGLHSVGLILGTIYTNNAPNLYENNIHNKIGWSVTWMVIAQYLLGLVRWAVSLRKAQSHGEEESAAIVPISVEALAHHQYTQTTSSPEPYRYSQDSGHYTASDSSRTQSISSMQDQQEEQQRKFREFENEHTDAEAVHIEKQGLLGNDKVQRLASGITVKLSRRTMRLLNAVYDTIDCSSLLLGFVAVLSGAVVYGGVFVSF